MGPEEGLVLLMDAIFSAERLKLLHISGDREGEA